MKYGLDDRLSMVLYFRIWFLANWLRLILLYGQRTCPLIAKELDVSKDYEWKLLKELGNYSARWSTRYVSTDPGSVVKPAEVVGLLLSPPENAVVMSIGEKPKYKRLNTKLA
jgi:hypothetical protein